MRPGLHKEILRSSTSYRLARSLVDGFFIAEILGTLFAAFFCLQRDLVGGQPSQWYLVGVLCAAIVALALAWLKRELLQLLFDIGDAQLEKRD